MEARRLRSALLFQHEDLIGRCHAFDGTILFLPKRLQHKVILKCWVGERVMKDFHLRADLPQSRVAFRETPVFSLIACIMNPEGTLALLPHFPNPPE